MHTHTYVHCLQEDHKVIPILRSLLKDNLRISGKVGHTSGVYFPSSFRTVVWILLRPKGTR